MWYDKVNTFLINNGYSKSKYEPCLYFKNEGKSITVVVCQGFFYFFK